MSVSTTTSSVIRIGDGVTVEFPFSFESQLTDIKVSYIVGTTLVPIDPSNYVVGVGTVTFGVAPANLSKLYIFRDTEPTQLVSVSSQQRYDPQVAEDVWDKLTFLAQEIISELALAVKTTPDQDPAELVTTLFGYRSDAQAAASTASTKAAEAAASAADALAKQNSMLRDRGAWATSILYSPSDIFTDSGNSYITQTAHIATSIAADLAASRIRIFAQKGATGAGAGDMNNADNLSGLTNKPLALATIGGQASDADLAALAANTTNGLWARTGTGTGATRTIVAGAGISIADGDGVAGNPTISESGIQWQTPISLSSGTSSNLSTTIPATVKEMYVRFRGAQLTTGDNVRLRIGPSGGLVTSGYHGGASVGGSALEFNSGFGLLLSNVTLIASGLFSFLKTDTNIWTGKMVGFDTGGDNPIASYGEVDAGGVVSQMQVSVTGGAFTGTGTWQLGWK